MITQPRQHKMCATRYQHVIARVRERVPGAGEREIAFSLLPPMYFDGYQKWLDTAPVGEVADFAVNQLLEKLPAG